MKQKADYRKELAETAQKICTLGKGILVADASQGTIGKKFVIINVDNNEENRRAYRELLFTSPGIENYISGVILFLRNSQKFVELLKEKGIVAGIKVDKDWGVIPGTQDESATLGLDLLANMAAEHYKLVPPALFGVTVRIQKKTMSLYILLWKSSLKHSCQDLGWQIRELRSCLISFINYRQAQLGKYQGGEGGASNESQFVADYKY